LGQPDLGGPQLSLAIGLPIIVFIGIGVGLANGSLVSFVGVPALIATLGMWQITRGLALRLTEGFSIGGLPERFSIFGQGSIAGAPVPTVIFIISIVLAYFVLMHTRFGRSVYAVGGNQASAWLSGVNVKRILLTVYVISGFTSAIAGIILSSRAMAASLNIASNLELDSIASVVIGGISLTGGRGSIWGVLIGVIIIGVVNNGMNLIGVPHGMQDVVRGAIIVIAVTIDILRRRRG
jgi:ribose transport system permease protein